MDDTADTAQVIIRPPLAWGLVVIAGLALNWLVPLPFLPVDLPEGWLGAMVFVLRWRWSPGPSKHRWQSGGPNVDRPPRLGGGQLAIPNRSMGYPVAIGSCNCTTGVADDDDLDRMSDFNLVGGEVLPFGAGRPITIAF